MYICSIQVFCVVVIWCVLFYFLSLLFGLSLFVVYIKGGCKSLNLAAESGHRDCVSQLLEAGASLEATDNVISSLSPLRGSLFLFSFFFFLFRSYF